MPATKSATIDFDAELFEALNARAAESDTSVSAVVNDAVRQHLEDGEEELEDMDDLERRRAEPGRPLNEVIADFKRRGLL